MGFILDLSVVIDAERKAKPIPLLLREILREHGSIVVMMSAVSVIEIAHGVWRADSVARMQRRRAFLDSIYSSIPIQPFTREVAEVAAKIDAEIRKSGRVVAFADLQIGATALTLGYELVTGNVRHFEMLPGLAVRRF